jgi:uncharacterized repeat protein (TIGR03803 family)
MAGLISVGGTLYGTTCLGGAQNSGTVFSITPAGKESVVYSFAGGFDGACPQASLLSYAGLLYGTTEAGGGSELGTVFGVSLQGTEPVQYSFQGNGDGATPAGGLIAVGTHLFGTTIYGGADPNQIGGNGTLFSMTPDGTETQIYQFGSTGSSPTDGAFPNGGLAWFGGRFYGSTGKGGQFGWGTLFSATLHGQEGPFLSAPEMGMYANFNSLARIGTKIFATTSNGGAHQAGSVVEVDPSTGQVKTLYSFAGGNDGIGPNGGLVVLNGKLYGTTAGGGAKHLGTVFSLTLSGVEKIVHAFAGCADGENPVGGLVDVGGTLYGTTYLSSSKCSVPNSGVVFAIKP